MSITERIDAVTNISEEYRNAIVPAPRSVKIELTGKCNFACYFCARAQRLRDVDTMDRVLFERLLLEMRDAGVEEIGMFYLGESFLVPWLPEAIKFAKDIGYPYIFLTTNGALSTPDKVKKCMENGLDSLKFSYNYADKKQFSDIARVKPELFDTMKENIKAAWKIKQDNDYKCYLSASYIMYDGEQGNRMLEAVEEIRPYVDTVYALPLYNQAALIKDDQQWEFTAGNRGRFDNLRDPLPCWSIFTEGHISFDGMLSACCFDHDGRFHMGDLKTTSFMDAWNSEKFQELRKAHLNKDVKDTVCEKCVAYS